MEYDGVALGRHLLLPSFAALPAPAPTVVSRVALSCVPAQAFWERDRCRVPRCQLPSVSMTQEELSKMKGEFVKTVSVSTGRVRL